MANRPQRQRRTIGEKVVLVLAAGLVVGIPGWLLANNYLIHRAANVALAKAWSVDGSPCPELTRAQFESRNLKAPKGTIYSNATLFRQFGHMSCSPIRDDGGTGLGEYAVCQFTGPAVLRVKTPKGEWFFEPGVGKPATIATPHDVARCVLASNFVAH